jgi:hypothetical protein
VLVESETMGILEIHLHDSEFELVLNPGSEKERSLSFGIGSRSGGGSTSATERSGQSGRPPLKPKLKSFAIMGLVVGAAFAVNRLRDRRARQKAADERSKSRRRPSLFRGK